MPKREDSPTVRRVHLAINCLMYAGAFWLALGTGPELVESAIVVALWTLGGLIFLSSYVMYGYSCFSDQGERWSKSEADRRRAERGRWWWLRRMFLFASMAALLWSGRPVLAALWLSVVLFWLASASSYKLIESTERLEDAAKPVEPADLGSWVAELIDLARLLLDGANVVFQLGMMLAWVLLLVPVVVASIPLVLILMPIAFAMAFWIEMAQAWTAREFKKAEGKPKGMIYFVYSEPHQHAHFLGPSGVLAPFATSVVARNWRANLWAGRNDFDSTSEAKLLRHFDISNQRKHLPFIAVIGRRSRVKDFKCNDAYRARLRDDGAALAKFEEEIRTAAARAFPDRN